MSRVTKIEGYKDMPIILSFKTETIKNSKSITLKTLQIIKEYNCHCKTELQYHKCFNEI